ncbi:MAG: hypothetical protein GXX90_06655 [Microbacteriaceae bacterium]|nr:hypothetical protein [Microbacteriaceae bacterium]
MNTQRQAPRRAPDSLLHRQLDRALTAQRPVAIAVVRRLRRQAPDATPEELLRLAERWYRGAAMSAGGGVGAAAAIPGVGTAVGAAIAGVEILGFLELSALYALVVAEIHGEPVHNPERGRTLVMAIMLGDQGKRLIQDFLLRRGAGGLINTAFWGELVAQAIPEVFVGELSRKLRDVFVQRFAGRQIGGAIGKLVPFGIGAAIGALGNATLAAEVIRNSRGAFGPPPVGFVGEIGDAALARADAEADERSIRRAVERAEREQRQLLRDRERAERKAIGRKERRPRRRRKSDDGPAAPTAD